jgi:HlyD family secretion protein
LGEGEKIVDCKANNKVWVREGKNFKAIAVTTGITNGTLTEVTGGLQAGQQVFTEISATPVAESEESDSKSNNNPFMPGPPDKNKKKTASK